MKEILVHVNQAIPEPYSTYIRSRNKNVALHIADCLGVKNVTEKFGSQIVESEKYYHVPPKSLSKDEADKYRILTTLDIYGGVVENRLHANKAIMHKTVEENSFHPDGYSSRFSALVENAVLPGYTVFRKDDARIAFGLLKEKGIISARLKDPTESDAAGQDIIRSNVDLEMAIKEYPDQKISEDGLVVEANIYEAITLSVGLVVLGGAEYSYYGKQKSVIHEGRAKYGGTKIRMLKGSFRDLSKTVGENNKINTAVKQTLLVYESFGNLNPILSRANFDVVQGYDDTGRFLSGVTDQSFRLGGASPAEILSIKILNANPKAGYVDACVDLIYSPQENVKSDEVVFLEHPNLRITSKVLGVGVLGSFDENF